MKQKGFTLIELMMVIAIIALLASIILVSLTSSQAKGRDGQRIANLRSIQLALETYYSDNDHYPCSIYTNPSASACQPGFVGSYLATVPTDPLYPSVTQSTCASAPTTQGCYFYSALYPTSGGSAAVCSYYHVGAVLEVSNNSALSEDAVNFVVGNYGSCTNGQPSGLGNTSASPFPGVGTTNCVNSGTPTLCYHLTPGT